MEPRLKLDYFTTSVIHLSLEDFHNAGLTPEETKAEIEKMRDYGSSILNLVCRESGINRNWNVHTQSTDPNVIRAMVFDIYGRLEKLLKAKVEAKRIKTQVSFS